MKKEIIIVAGSLVLAFLAGGLSSGSRDSRSPAAAPQIPAKATVRSEPEKRQRAASAPESWATLRRHAGMKQQALLDEWMATGSGGFDCDWLGEHLLRTDPEAIFRELNANGLETKYLASTWCAWDPERALPLLMDGKPPFAIKRDSNSFTRSSPLYFGGIGRENPELGLKWMLERRGALARSQPGVFMGSEPFNQFLAGVAASHPEKVFGFFKQIADARAVPASHLATMLPSLAQSDPTKALAWAKQRYSTLPPGVAAGLAQGLAERDLDAAIQMVPEISDKNHVYNAASRIASRMARENGNLDESLAWIDANVPKNQSSLIKDTAMAAWIQGHPQDVLKRLASESASSTSRFSDAATSFLQAKARSGKLPGLMESLSPEEATSLRPLLGEQGPQEEGESADTGVVKADAVLAQMKSAPEETEGLWDSLPEEKRTKLLNDLARNDNASRDPEQTLRFLSRSPERLAGSSAQFIWDRLIQVDPQAAGRLAASLPAASRKPELVARIVSTWSADDSVAAQAWQKEMSAAGQ